MRRDGGGSASAGPCGGLRRPGVEDFAALFARARTDVDDPVGAAHDVELVLDDKERVAGALERIERAEEGLGVGRMQAGGGLVEDVDDSEEIGVQLGGEAEALQLAGESVGVLRSSER